MRWMFAIATMPVILEPSDWPTWLREVIDDPATLLRPAGHDLLRVWPVSRRVSASQVDGAVALKAILIRSPLRSPFPST